MGSKSWSRIMADELGRQGAKQTLVLVLAATLLVVLQSVTINYALASAAPDAPTLYLPADGIYTNDNTVYFEWTVSANADNHRLLVDNDSDFSSPEENVVLGATDNTYTISAPGLADENYSWKVIAINANGENKSSTRTFVIDTIAPAIPTLVSPENNVTENALTQTFTWIEPEVGVTYDIQIDNETSFTSLYVHENTGLADNLYIYTFTSNGVYYWCVRAVDAANNQSSWADNFKLTIQVPPGQPTLYLLADGAVTNDNTPIFEWIVGALADNYRLLVDNDPDFSSPEENRILLDNYYNIAGENSLPNDNYSWKVIAINAYGENGSSTWTFVIDTNAPATPTLASPGDNAVGSTLTQTFTWTEPEAGVTYDIQIDNETSFTSPYVHENTGLADNSYTYTFASNGGVYYWRVRAVDAANNQSSWADNFKLVIQAPPNQPTLYLPVDGAVTNDNAPTFEWTVGAIADNHRLLVDNDPDFSSPEENRIVLDNYYTIADENSLPDDNYSWKVIAVNAYGENGSSTWTSLIDTVATATPTLVLPETDAVESALTQTFTWIEPEVSVTYDIQIDNETSFTSPYVHENTGLADNSYTYTFASDGVYYWRVCAVDAANNQSSWADNFKLTIQVPTSEPTPPAGAIPPSDDSTPDLEPVPLPPEGALTITISEIKAGQTGSADFTQHAIAVTGVRITTTSDVSGARVDVVMHESKPAGAAEIASPVYTYFDLSTTVGTDYIEGAKIKFKVPRSWIAQMDIDEGTIRLLRYREGWQRLSTDMIGADSAYLYYEATTSGFSVFAIAGEPMVAPTPTPWDTPTVPPPTRSPPFLYAALFMTAGVVGFAAAYRLARPSRYYVMLKRLKQLERELIRPSIRSIGPPLPKPPARVPKRVSRAEPTPRRLKRIRHEKLLKERKAYREFKDVKQKLWITDRELRRMEENRWSHTKNMLRFGFASWVFGLSVFILAIVVISAKLFGGAPMAWTSMFGGTLLLGGAHAAPVTVTAASVRKYDKKIKRLKRIRRGLVMKYQRAVLQYVGQVAAPKV